MTGNFEVLDMEKKAKYVKMRELLKVAACPDDDCDEGIVHRGRLRENWHKCQWCDEREEVLNG